jgi:arsenate reductase (thioredoxin)
MKEQYNVLFLCTGNSVRSIIAEAILNRAGDGRFKAFSAGSHPKGQVNPRTLDLLRKFNYDVSTLRSKSWGEYAQAGAPDLDFVFTVCDNAAGESCPLWPGQPITAHWGIPDPAAAEGSEAEIALAFKDAYRMLNRRIELFLALPIEKLDRLVLTTRLNAIGRTEGATEKARHVNV